jgi:two-component system KDP operon response regulator KdpE
MDNNILIMENNPNIQKLVRVNLAKRGYVVNTAENMSQVVTLFQEVPVDLVVLDAAQPGLSCVNVCRWIRERSDVPIIVLSAWLEQDIRAAYLNAGANEYITKPFGLEELLESVRSLLFNSYALYAHY